jgi:hypothetical protein
MDAFCLLFCQATHASFSTLSLPRVSGAFYTTASWLVKDLRTYGYPLMQTQTLLIVSLLVNMVSLLSVGYLMDKGLRPLRANALFVVVGVAVGYGVFMSVGKSLPTAWGVVCAFQAVLGAGMANVGLPCTRIYEPLQVRCLSASLGGGRAGERQAERSVFCPSSCPPVDCRFIWKLSPSPLNPVSPESTINPFTTRSARRASLSATTAATESLVASPPWPSPRSRPDCPTPSSPWRPPSG